MCRDRKSTLDFTSDVLVPCSAPCVGCWPNKGFCLKTDPEKSFIKEINLSGGQSKIQLEKQDESEFYFALVPEL